MADSGRGQRKNEKTSLRDEVRDALLTILRDSAVPATARAHAARSLVLMLGDTAASDPEQRAASSMSIDELDAEIASIQQSLTLR